MHNRKPAWWQLYLLLPISGGALTAEHMTPLPGVTPEVAVSGIVIMSFVLMLVWVHVNGGLLEWYEVDRDESIYDLKITIHEPSVRDGLVDLGSVGASSSDVPHSMAQADSSRMIQSEEEEKWLLN